MFCLCSYKIIDQILGRDSHYAALIFDSCHAMAENQERSSVGT